MFLYATFCYTSPKMSDMNPFSTLLSSLLKVGIKHVDTSLDLIDNVHRLALASCKLFSHAPSSKFSGDSSNTRPLMSQQDSHSGTPPQFFCTL